MTAASVRNLGIALVAAGIAARFALVAASVGTIDAELFERYGSEINEFGLYESYRQDARLNHPPIAALWFAATWKVAQRIDVSFVTLFKSQVALADCATIALLWLIVRRRADASTAWLAAVFWACNPNAILVSAYPCNSDAALTMLAVLSLWLVENARRPLLAGLAIGAAINIKLTASVVLIPILLLSRRRGELLSLSAGAALAAVPMLWVWAGLGYRFRQRVLEYHPAPTGWGLHNLLDLLSNHPLLKSYFDVVAERYLRAGGAVILLSVTLATLVLRRWHADRIFACAIAVAVYAVVSPVMAMHHTILVGPFLLLWSFPAGIAWGLLAGAATFSCYLFGWVGTLPMRSTQTAYGTGPYPMLAAVLWTWIVIWTWRTLHGQRQHSLARTLQSFPP